MTYGLIAEVLAERLGRGGPRQVGHVLAGSGGAVPWWRVVNASGAFVLGDLHCVSACTQRCFLADSTRTAPGVIPLLTGGPETTAGERIEVARDLGLPPLYLGGF